MILKRFEALQLFLSEPRKIVIVGHRNPDGDAVGSTLALLHYLEKKGHCTKVIMPNEFPKFLNWLPKAETIYKFERQTEQSKTAIMQSELIFLLDFNALHRTGEKMKDTLESCSKPFAMIDHHRQPQEIAKYVYSDDKMSSTCQMVYNFIEMNKDISLIDRNIAACIYTGIMTDTGSFRFRCTTATTHRIVADLIDKGAENDKIHHRVYDDNSYERLLLLGQSLKNLQILQRYKTAFITLSEKEKKQFNFQKGDTEGVVNYTLSIRDIVFGVLFVEDKEQKIIKISFRSKGKFSVNQFARKHFKGGGHDNAAGGKTELSMEETIKEFTELLPIYESELQNSYES